MRSWLTALAFVLFASGCDDSINWKEIVGPYDAQVTLFDNTDNNVMSLSQGTKSTLLIDFTTGIRSDPAGPSPNGIRASLHGDKIKITAQPGYVDNANGTALGTFTGMGTITHGMPEKVDLTLTFQTGDDEDFVQPNDAGAPVRADGGSGTIMLTVKATKR